MKLNTTIDALIEREGGYVNNPADKGRETKYGITQADAHEMGYQGAMKDLPIEAAQGFYRAKYWVKPGFEQISLRFPTLGEKLLDIGVNCGVFFASVCLQRCLNVLNNQGKLYPDLKTDGNLGQVSISALNDFLNFRGEPGRTVLLFMVAALQAAQYIKIAEQDPKQEQFIYGWEQQRALYEALL